MFEPLILSLSNKLVTIFFSSVQGHIITSRRALVAFLARYPLCYGYWKKFADLERRASNNDKAEEVKQTNNVLNVCSC